MTISVPIFTAHPFLPQLPIILPCYLFIIPFTSCSISRQTSYHKFLIIKQKRMHEKTFFLPIEMWLMNFAENFILNDVLFKNSAIHKRSVIH